MNQNDLQTLAQERIRDAEVLLNGGRWAFAYYVAGYAVECGLKSCVLARMVHTGHIFTRRKIGDECLTHDFKDLVELAGLKDELDDALKQSAAGGKEFIGFWGTVNQWRETVRYTAKTEAEARGLLEAITSTPHGVMPWIQRFW